MNRSELLTPKNSLVQLIQNYEGPVRKQLALSMSNPDDIDDLYQDLMVRAVTYRNKEQVKSAYSYIKTILKNMLHDKHRRDTVRCHEKHISTDFGIQAEIACNDPAPEKIVNCQSELKRLFGVMSKLKPNTRKALLLNRMDGLTYKEIALEMEISTSMVQKHISHATKQLKVAMPDTFPLD